MIICWSSGARSLWYFKLCPVQHRRGIRRFVPFFKLEVRWDHGVVALAHQILLVRPPFIRPRRYRILLSMLVLPEELGIVWMHERLQLDFTPLDIAAIEFHRSGIYLLIIHLNLTILNQIIHLKYLVTRLRFQFYLVVAHLIQIAGGVQLGRHVLVSVTFAGGDVSEAPNILITAPPL